MIVSSFFDSEKEFELMKSFLSNYRKGGGNWEEYRQKIPTEILAKWLNALKECNKSGFFNPRVFDGKLTWEIAVGDNKNVTECSLCQNSLARGTCSGKDNGKNFVECWRNAT